MGPCLILLDHLSCLSRRKTRWTMLVHLLNLTNCILGTSTSMVPLSVNESCLGTTSATNQCSYIALVPLLGPQCKPAIRLKSLMVLQLNVHLDLIRYVTLCLFQICPSRCLHVSGREYLTTRDWKVSSSVAWYPLSCGSRNAYSKHVGCFVSLILLVVGGGPMSCSKSGVCNFSHLIIGWVAPYGNKRSLCEAC